MPQKIGDEGEILETVFKGLERFNDIRAPEARAQLVEFREGEILVRFSGYMCFSCGLFDYFDDLIYELRDFGIEIKIKDFRREGEDCYLVTYKIKNF
jgi:hypothetical protein